MQGEGYFRNVLGGEAQLATADRFELPAAAEQLARVAYNVYAGGRLVCRRQELDSLEDATEKRSFWEMRERRSE